MVNLNKRRKTKSKPKPTQIQELFTCACVYHQAPLSCTTYHRTVLISFPLNLQTVIKALMLSAEGMINVPSQEKVENRLSSQFGTKCQREVPLFLEIFGFHFNRMKNKPR